MLSKTNVSRRRFLKSTAAAGADAVHRCLDRFGTSRQQISHAETEYSLHRHRQPSS